MNENAKSLVEGATTGEIRELLRKLEEAKSELQTQLVDAKHDPRRDLSLSEIGTAKDSAVQRYAAQKLKDLRRQGLSFEEIGDMGGVSRERARQIFERLCPFEYDAEKRERTG